LSTATVEEIKGHIRKLDKYCESVEHQIFMICYAMKGGVTWNDAWGMSPLQRNNVIKWINEVIEKKQEAMKRGR